VLDAEAPVADQLEQVVEGPGTDRLGLGRRLGALAGRDPALVQLDTPSPGEVQTPGRAAASRKAEVGVVAERHGHRPAAGWPDGGRHRERSAIDLDRRLQMMREGEGGQQLLARVLEPGAEPGDPAAGLQDAHVPWLPRRHRPVDRQPVGVGVQVEPSSSTRTRPAR
jgi:hypothetical protein